MSELLFIPFSDYIKDLCTRHKDVLHVDGINAAYSHIQTGDELQTISSIAGRMVVIFSSYVGRAVGEFDDSRMNQNASLLFLYRPVGGSGNPAGEVKTAQQIAGDVMLQFYMRMKKDFEDDDCGILKWVRFEQMNFEILDGPVLEAHYGWEMSIPFDARFPAYDPAKWNS
jgi:hypothetical protein